MAYTPSAAILHHGFSGNHLIVELCLGTGSAAGWYWMETHADSTPICEAGPFPTSYAAILHYEAFAVHGRHAEEVRAA